MADVYRMIGPPGTGKTYDIANHRVPRAVRRYGPRGVVCCSLTRAAARVLGSRVEIPPENVGTLHALAYRGLGRPDLAEKHLGDWNRLHPAWALSSHRADPDNPYEVKSEGAGVTPTDALYERLELLRHRRTPRAKWGEIVGHALAERLGSFADAWGRWLRDENLVDFTGMIERGLEELPSAPGSPGALIVDEAQDCSTLEIELARRWADSAESLLLTGDSNQAIYGFRGGDPEAFLPTGVDPTWVLGQSFRLPKNVQHFAERLIRWSGGRTFEYHARTNDDGDVVEGSVDRSPMTFSDPGIVDEIDKTDGTVMFLASCNFLLQHVIDQLRERGTPFHNPYRPTQGAWNPMRGGASRLAAFLGPAQRNDGTLWTYKELARWSEHLQAKRVFGRGAKKSIKERSARAKDDYVAGSWELQGLFAPGVWNEMLTTVDAGVDAAAAWFRSNLLSSKELMYEYASRVIKKHGLRAVHEPPRVIVGTIHSCKGGEADRVVLCPDLSRAGFENSAYSEKARLMYVGATRAKESLVVARNGNRKFKVDM